MSTWCGRRATELLSIINNQAMFEGH